MSGSVLTLTIILLLHCIHSTRQSVCPTSCCECILGGQETQCSGSTEYPNFCDFPTVLEKLELANYTKSKLDYNFNKVREIEYLIIKNSPITILSGLIEGQKSLKRLKLIDISLTEGWEWGDLFAQFNKLMDFDLRDTDLSNEQLVINGSTDKNNNNVISFSVNRCGIKSIKTNLITTWIHLKMISLAHNCIRDLDRHWFPSQLESLWSLDLSYNSIDNIPDKFFEGMTALRKLRLDNNSLTTLRDNWFLINVDKQQFWKGLHELWIDSNQIQCSSNLSWIPDVFHPTFFDEGTCNSKNGAIYFFRIRKGDDIISNLTSVLL